MTVEQLATLVSQLRVVQKSSGSGYKTTTAGTQAKALETEVDAAIASILKPPVCPTNGPLPWPIFGAKGS